MSSHKSMFSLSFHMPCGASSMKPQSMGRIALLGGTSMSDTSMQLLVGQLILNITPLFSLTLAKLKLLPMGYFGCHS